MATSGLSYDNRSSPSGFALGIGTVINDHPSKPWINYYIWTPRPITLPRSRCACGVTNLLFSGNEVCNHRYNYTKGRNQRRNNANDSFGKGLLLKDHVLNRLMTGRCPSKSLQIRPKFHSLFLQNSFDFQKSATFKGLKSSPTMYWCKFQPWKRRLLQNKKVTHTDWLTDRQSD